MKTISRSLFVLLIAVFCSITSRAQLNPDIPIGTWRTHLSYSKVFQVEESPTRIYAAATSSLLYYDKTDKELMSFSKMEGLTSTGVSSLKYAPQHKTLVIGYEDGNIDLLVNEQQIYNISGILRSSVIGSKRINHISIDKDFAYLSCGFGLVVLNLAKREIKESNTLLGNNGLSQTAVISSVVLNDTLYAATQSGLKFISLNRNLMNTSLWANVTAFSGDNISAMELGDAAIYLVSKNGNQLWKSQNSRTWQSLSYSSNQEVRNIKPLANNELLVSSWQSVFLVNATSGQTTTLAGGNGYWPYAALRDNEGNYWIADAAKGLLRVAGTSVEPFVINGPDEDASIRLFYYNQKMVSLPGGYTSSTNAPLTKQTGYSVFEQNQWQTFSPSKTPAMPYVQDLVTAAYSATDNTLYIGSFSHGILTLKNGAYGLINHETPGTSLTEILPYEPNYRKLRIADLKVDRHNNLWAVSNLQSTTPAIHVRRAKTGQWQSFQFGLDMEPYVLELVVADNDDKWVRASPSRPYGSLLVFNDAGKFRELGTVIGSGGLPDRKVNCIAKDLEGQILVGTDQGLAVFDNPDIALNGTSYNARLPIIDGRPILETDAVTAIAVDGGNRKWLGTRRTGLWLFDADCEKLIAHFDTKNSPLISDNIMALGINAVTGEVFISTDKGMMSYRSTATEGTLTHSSVKVFPNPVAPDFDGLIGISGLANNATVKITDISGKLMYETKAQGGEATWNRRNYTGQEAESGVYLIFSASETGEDTFVGKIALIK